MRMMMNRDKKRSKTEKRRRIDLIPFDQNLLIPLDLSRLRQIVIKSVSRLLTEGLLGSSPARCELRLVLAQTKVPRKSSCLPKLFLRLPTKIQASDYPLTLAKPFFHFLLVDNKEVRFYHHHWKFLGVLRQNPPSPPYFLNPVETNT